MQDSSHYIVRALLAEGVVGEADVKRAQEHASTIGRDVVESLVELGVVSARRLAIERAKICEYPFVDLSHFEIDFNNTKLIPKGVVERLMSFPLFLIEGTATVGMLDPLNLSVIDQLRQFLKMDVEPVLCDSDQLRALIARAYGLAGTQVQAAPVGKNSDGDEDLTTGEEPIVAAVNQILVGAIEAGASDAHINPDDHEVFLRYRVDGVLQAQQGPAKAAHPNIVQRLKVLAKLDLTQTRKPQDGKFRFVHKDQAVDIRLSVLPTIHGENVVMRLLRSATAIGSLRDLDMPDDMTAWYEEAINRPHGMILVTGPTGSGKTTTLYCALQHINTPDQNIMTIEDPVEIRLNMIRQVQVSTEIGLTFATALRSILRQDPDVVLVGEIRDEETAKIAVQAALTGHLVFSTLHTNDAVSSITRLKDFGLPAFAINNALVCVIAQRLVRRVCSQCAQTDQPDTREMAIVGIDPARATQLKKGIGCGACRSTGYKGRAGVYEMLRVTPRVQRLIEKDSPASEVKAAAELDGMRGMLKDGVEKALRGVTTVSELMNLVTVADAEIASLRCAA
ncbi:MAG: GspE/PulE family protein [Planctomycetota bacterium]